MGLGNFGGVGALFALAFMALVWLVPIVALVWFVRTLSAVAATQREIVSRLARIDEQLRATRGGF